MIVSASYKTDIPALYGTWFMNRLDAGFVRVVNPYGGAPGTVALDRKAVDGLVFWSRNARPFMGPLAVVGERGYPFVLQMTITGYPRALETATIEATAAIAQVREIAATFGTRSVVWRYDPVVLTTLTPPDWHLENLSLLCGRLAGAVDEVVVSMVHGYAKTIRNLNAAAKAGNFQWWDPEGDEKRALLGEMAAIADDYGIAMTLCGQRDLLTDAGSVDDAACIDIERLSDVAGFEITAPRKAHRGSDAPGGGCGCWASRDIGDYDTCTQGCVYCYAVQNKTRLKACHRRHDPDGEFLVPPKEKK